MLMEPVVISGVAKLALYESKSGKIDNCIIIPKTGSAKEELHYKSENAPLCKVYGVSNSFTPISSPVEWDVEKNWRQQGMVFC